MIQKEVKALSPSIQQGRIEASTEDGCETTVDLTTNIAQEDSASSVKIEDARDSRLQSQRVAKTIGVRKNLTN